MTLGHLQYERDQIAGFRRVHAALTERAEEMGYETVREMAEEVGIDAFDGFIAEECEAENVDAFAFIAWASEPDGDTEILDSMGYFNP